MKRHRDGAEPEKTENVQIRICASCPSEEYNRVEAICSELQIGKAFGRKGDFMEDTDGKGWFGKWQNRVLQSLDLLLQPYAQKTVFVSFHLLLITDGTSPHCAKEREGRGFQENSATGAMANFVKVRSAWSAAEHRRVDRGVDSQLGRICLWAMFCDTSQTQAWTTVLPVHTCRLLAMLLSSIVPSIQ